MTQNEVQLLNDTLRDIAKALHRGNELADPACSTDGYVYGMATVAEENLQAAIDADMEVASWLYTYAPESLAHAFLCWKNPAVARYEKTLEALNGRR
jgi:hypothetical protein